MDSDANPKSRLPEAIFAVVMAIGALALLYWHRDIGPWLDEWPLLIARDGVGAQQLFGEHNGHLMLLPVLVYKLVGVLFSPGATWPLAVVSTGLQMLVATLVFVFVRRRLGSWPALLIGVLVLFLGTGWEVIVWSVNIGWLGAFAAGLGALLVFETGDSRRIRMWSSALLLVALCCGGIGLVFVLGIATGVFWRERRTKTLAVVAMPLVFYTVWYLVWGLDYHHEYGLDQAPRFIADMVAYGFGGVMGMSVEWGRSIAVLAAGATFVALSRQGRIRAGTALVLSMPLLFWGLTAIARAGWAPADGSRYIFVSGVLILLALAELTRGARLSQGAWVAAAALFVFVLAGNVVALKDGAAIMRDLSASSRADLTAIAIAGSRAVAQSNYDPVDANLWPNRKPAAYELLTEGGAKFDESPAELAHAAPAHRAKVDGALAALTPIVVSQATRRRGTCRTTAAGSPQVETSLGRTPVYVSAHKPLEVWARRYGDSFSDRPATELRPGRHLLSVDLGNDIRPWVIRLRSEAAITVCTGG